MGKKISFFVEKDLVQMGQAGFRGGVAFLLIPQGQKGLLQPGAAGGMLHGKAVPWRGLARASRARLAA